MHSSQYLLLANAVSTLFLVGLIWMVQIVHYPLFDGIGEDQYVSYQQRHQTKITFIVAPMMVIELVTAIMLLVHPVQSIDRSLVLVGVALVVLIWLSTALIQVPCHAKLSKGFDHAAYVWLVNSNWIRTIAWTIRGGLVTLMMVRVLSE